MAEIESFGTHIRASDSPTLCAIERTRVLLRLSDEAIALILPHRPPEIVKSRAFPAVPAVSYRKHLIYFQLFGELQCLNRHPAPCHVDEYIQGLLKKLLATEDAAEFDQLSNELKSALHARIEQLRKEARGLKTGKVVEADRRKRPRNGKNKP